MPKNPGVLGGANKNSQSKNNKPSANAPAPTSAASVVSAAFPGPGSSKLNVTFSETVRVVSLPSYTVDVTDAVLVNATSLSPVIIEFTFDRDISTATTLSMDYNDPAIRTQSGGFVADRTFAI